ncbi:hypothetical protein ACKKBG_A25495 [Auxenochlorella protothecoides x Auxenochlorella symbiontica]|uniref:Transmembrane protein 184C n=1 Tax=Auxenochlorella protothecoides TaxID=3075 RepID=A0A1D2AFH3_AUXPR
MAQFPMRRVFRGLWILLTLCTFSALPWMIVELRKQHFSVHYQAWFIAGVFVILAVSASIYEVAMHLEHYNRPALQIRVVRILWMVPIYAVDAWLSLRFSDARTYIDPLRECYEAFVIYNFYCYLMAYLEEEYGDVDAYYATRPPVPHPAPMDRLLRPWAPGADFFWETKRGVLAYVITRPLTTAVGVVTNLAGVYGDGEFRHDRAYPWLATVGSLSQTWALYCLILMYRATRQELAPIRPLAKFLVIKAVVFLTFWQSVGINLASKFDLLKPASWSTYDDDDIAAGLQNFLICLEMFAAAIAHAHAFPPRDYMDPNSQRPGFLKNVKVMFDVRDVVDDVQDVVTDTGDNIADMGRRTWKQAKNHTANLVQSPPSYLKGLFARDAKLRRKEGEGVPYSDEDSSPTRGSLHALLQRSQSRPGPISSSP